MKKRVGFTRPNPGLKRLCFPDVKAPDQPVFHPENVTHHLVREHAAVEVPHDLMNLDDDLSLGANGEGNRLNARIDHGPLARPIAADFVAP